MKDKRHLTGYKNEFLVGQYYLSKGYKVVAHRFKTPFAEVDLICQHKNQELVIVEVKSAAEPFWESYRIGFRQKHRLKNAAIHLMEKSGRNIEVHLAFVDKDGRIDILRDFLG
ncbi:MAG: YraN family protein [Pseudomonadota bacterium]|nr:YraN family protein [Pseudomonadota bacterium]